MIPKSKQEFPEGRLRRDLDPSAQTLNRERNGDVSGRKIREGFFAPFRSAYSAGTEFILEPGVLEFLRLFEAVEVEVIDREFAAGIRLEQREGRALHGAFPAEAAERRTDEACLSGPQIAFEAQGEATGKDAGIRAAKGIGEQGAEMVGVCRRGKRRRESIGQRCLRREKGNERRGKF